MTGPAALTASRRLWLWGGILAAIVAAIWLLSPVLFPFLVGLAIAYVLDPAVDKVERWGVGRTFATSLVMAAFFFILAAIILLLSPILVDQVHGLTRWVAQGIEELQGLIRPYLEEYLNQPQQKPDGKGAESIGIATQAIKWAGGMAGQLVQGGIAVFNILSLIFVTPVVTFYLLRDWDRMVAAVITWLPRDRRRDPQAAAARSTAVLAGFLRGQAPGVPACSPSSMPSACLWSG